MNSAIKEALDKVRREEARLQAERDRIDTELVKVAAVRAMLEKQAGMPTQRKLAPAGLLDEAILKTLDRTKPKSRGQIIAAISATGYAYPLTPLHVTKHLIALAEARKVKRLGTGNATGYLRGSVS